MNGLKIRSRLQSGDVPLEILLIMAFVTACRLFAQFHLVPQSSETRPIAVAIGQQNAAQSFHKDIQ
jgi:hypothetical protein